MEYKARITVYSSIGQVEQIKALAYADGTSLSDYICKLMDAHLAKQRAKLAKQPGAPAPEHVTLGRDAGLLPRQTRIALPEIEDASGNG